MIRRPPTVIQLTTQDVLDYDDQRALAKSKLEAQKENNGASQSPVRQHHELTSAEKNKRIVQDREMRMGLNK